MCTHFILTVYSHPTLLVSNSYDGRWIVCWAVEEAELMRLRMLGTTWKCSTPLWRVKYYSHYELHACEFVFFFEIHVFLLFWYAFRVTIQYLQDNGHKKSYPRTKWYATFLFFQSFFNYFFHVSSFIRNCVWIWFLWWIALWGSSTSSFFSFDNALILSLLVFTCPFLDFKLIVSYLFLLFPLKISFASCVSLAFAGPPADDGSESTVSSALGIDVRLAAVSLATLFAGTGLIHSCNMVSWIVSLKWNNI